LDTGEEEYGAFEVRVKRAIDDLNAGDKVRNCLVLAKNMEKLLAKKGRHIGK